MEVSRAVRRVKADETVKQRARAVLAHISLVAMDGPVLQLAADLAPQSLRTLDAIHLATAISVKHDVDLVVTYDTRFGEAAVLAGLLVEAPT